MADIKRCDRCGEAYNPYNNSDQCFDSYPDIDKDLKVANFVAVGIEMGSAHLRNHMRTFDLCQNCMKEFIEFITREGESKSE